MKYLICNIQKFEDCFTIIEKLRALIGPVFTLHIDDELRAKCFNTLLVIEDGDKHVATHTLPDLIKIQTTMQLFNYNDAWYQSWFQSQVTAAVEEADDPNAIFTSHDQVMATMDTIIEQASTR